MNYSENMNAIPRIFRVFFLTLLVSTLGVYIGSFVPEDRFVPLIVLEFCMIIAMIFIRKSKTVSYAFLYAFVLISGATLYPVLTHYVHSIGVGLVVQAFVITTITFAVLSVYAAKSKTDFNYLGGFLFGGLIALILVGICGIFFPLGGFINLVYTLGGILIFMGYILYDVNKICKYGVEEEEIPMIVLSLYLDFINLFLFILRLIGINVGNKN